MASSKVMKSSNTRNSDLSRRSSSSSTTKPQQQQQQLLQQQQQQQLQQQEQILTDASKFATAMTVDGILRNVYNTTAASTTDATLLDAQITLIDTNDHHQHHPTENENVALAGAIKTVDDVWREIVSGEKKEMKEEAVDEMMTLEDFLAKAGAVEDAAAAAADVDVKAVPPITERLSGGVYAFDPSPASPFQVEGQIVGFGNGAEVVGGVSGRGKRGRVLLEPLDKAAQQRQRRMIKNRESAARSRERKQAYQVELESLAVRLEEENERLLKEKAERIKERYKQLMEKVVPVVEKRRPPRVLRRVRSMQW